jgi:hypothetical protein
VEKTMDFSALRWIFQYKKHFYVLKEISKLLKIVKLPPLQEEIIESSCFFSSGKSCLMVCHMSLQSVCM